MISSYKQTSCLSDLPVHQNSNNYSLTHSRKNEREGRYFGKMSQSHLFLKNDNKKMLAISALFKTNKTVAAKAYFQKHVP